MSNHPDATGIFGDKEAMAAIAVLVERGYGPDQVCRALETANQEITQALVGLAEDLEGSSVSIETLLKG